MRPKSSQWSGKLTQKPPPIQDRIREPQNDLVANGPPTTHPCAQRALPQPLTPRPCSSPSSSSSPSLPVSELGDGGWVPSGSSSLVELTIDTLRTGPYRSNTAHTFWGHKRPRKLMSGRPQPHSQNPRQALDLPWQCQWLQAPYPLHLPGCASCHPPPAECPHGSPPRTKVRQGQMLSPPLPATPTPNSIPCPWIQVLHP